MSDTVIDLGNRVRVVGTAHVSKTSIDLVQEQISEFGPDIVAVELCESRLKSLENPSALDDEDLLSIIKDGRSGMILLQSALASQQRRMGIEHGEKPGAELLRAVDLANEMGLPVELIDRMRHCQHCTASIVSPALHRQHCIDSFSLPVLLCQHSIDSID